MRSSSNQYGSSSKKLKIDLTYDSALPPMFITALFTIGKLWNQPRCPSINGWVDKENVRYHIYIYSIYTHHIYHIYIPYISYICHIYHIYTIYIIYMCVLCVYIKYSFVSHKGEGNYVVCRKMNETRDQYVKWNKPISRIQVLHVFSLLL
jgi:cytochrome bd-type quinol oxidase subunit 1